MLIEFSGKVLVVGDIMLDSFVSGSVSRISPEAPVPVVLSNKTRSIAGGAANVAMNLSSLGISTTLVGATGSDDNSIALSKILIQGGVKQNLVSSNQPTTHKMRVMCGAHQLVRVDTEGFLNKLEQSSVFTKFIDELQMVDVVIMSDYFKGCIDDPQKFIIACKENGKQVFVDPKQKDLSVYKGADLLKPNESEFCNYIEHECKTDADFIRYGSKLRSDLKIRRLLITRGEKGMILFEPDQEPYFYRNTSQKVFDVTGAGDTVLSVIAACFCSQIDWRQAIEISSTAASIAVENIGTTIITTQELNSRLLRKPKFETKIYSELEHLKRRVVKDKAAGQRIVFTNGCFDILHPGHAKYLEEASAQGDILIVAVNTDNSVRGLKGFDRPINSLNDRMAVLASLSAVDYVIPFDSETPKDLISELLPSVLVKGGDYQDREISGSEVVIENGGRVHISCLVQDVSTSQIIQSIREKV